VTTSDIIIDPVLYQLFERIVREAPVGPDTEYTINTTGERSDGTPYTYTTDLDGSQKDQLPWGRHDAIIRATWYAQDELSRKRYAFVQVHVDSFNNGIGIVSTFEHPGQISIRVSEREFRSDRGGIVHYGFTTEDGVVAKVLEFIHAAIEADNNKLNVFDGYTDEERRDPLNEFSVPRWER